MSKKSILITGGTGTFGKAFIDHCVQNKLYERIVIFSRDEYKQSILKNTNIVKKNEKIFRFFIGDVRDKDRLKTAFRGVDDVIHAAALKHVPFCEYNPDEALKTNVVGTKNVCEMAIEEEVKKVIFLSTDKAVEPINFYGSTKMLAEKYSVYSNNHSKNVPGTNKTVSIASYKGYSFSNLPPFSKCGSTLSSCFRKNLILGIEGFFKDCILLIKFFILPSLLTQDLI